MTYNDGNSLQTLQTNKKKKAKTKLVFLYIIFQPLPPLSSGGHKWQAYVFFSGPADS